MDKELITNYFWIHGRIGRMHFFLRLLLFGLGTALMIVFAMGGIQIMGITGDSGFFLVMCIYLIGYWAIICSHIQRLHDVNYSGWWALLHFIPIFNFVLMVTLLVTLGTCGENRFGPSPAAREQEIEKLYGPPPH